MFVGLILLFGFLTFPAKKGDERVNHMPWYDIVLLIAGPGAYFFYAVNAQNVVQMSARVMQNDAVLGTANVLETYIYYQTFNSGAIPNYGYTTAVGLFKSLVGCVLVLFCNHLSKKVRDGRGIV